MNTVEYKGFTCRYPLITYSYEWNGREYHRQVDLGNLSRVQSENCDAMVRDRLIAHVGLAIAREFFRIERIDRIIVRPPHFFEESAAFFETWFRAGLAELRYVNGIPLDEPIEFLIDKPQNPQPAECTGTGILLCNGGGKDSVVAAEALNHAGEPFTWLSLSPSLAMEGIQSLSGAPGLHVRAGLGRAEFKAQKRFRGHLPFLPMVALTGTLVAHLQNFACVAAGNEYSANFGNLEHNGFSVNHQYGKSFEFENLLRAYLARNLTRISWFSLLQPFYELQVAQAFARFPQYFQVFKSCNAGHRRDRWCRHCPKCAFIYLTLSAFLDRTAIFEIFDGDPWKESRIRETVRDLVTGARKPFECVGTFDEAREAARLMLENPTGPGAQPDIAAALRQWLPARDGQTERPAIMSGHRSRPHNIPAPVWPHIAEFFEMSTRSAAETMAARRTGRSHAVLILGASPYRRVFELDMAGRLLLQALDRAGIEWTLHCPWLPLPPAGHYAGVLSWSFRHDENNFVFWARKAEAFYRGAGLRVLNSVESFSVRHSHYLRRWHEAGIPCARFERFSDIDGVTLPYPLILRCDGLHKGRNAVLVHSREEAQTAIEDCRAEGVILDLSLEFLDLRFPDGYYRNRFAFIAGERVIPRQHAIGRDWLLNFETAEASAQSVREDRAFRDQGEERSELVLRAARATGADIVGLDYGISPDGDYFFWEGHRHFKMTGDAGYRTEKLESATGRAATARAADDEALGNAMAELLRTQLFPIAAVA